MRRPAVALVVLAAWIGLGGLLPGIPGAWGVFPLLGVLPGLALALAVPLEAGALARWALALASAPLVTTAAAWLLMRAGLPLAAAARAVAALSALACVALEWRRARRGAEPPDEGLRAAWAWALGGGAVIAVVMFANPWLRMRGDAWVHGGIVWEILERGIPPQDPRFAGLTLNYVWFHNYFLALLTALRGDDPFVFMALSNAASLFATLAIGALLARALWGGGRAATAGAVLLALGYNAGWWMTWPVRLVKAFVGRDTGATELGRELAEIRWNDAEVIFSLNAPFSYMASFLDKFLHGTAINVAYLMMLVMLWAMVRALGGQRGPAWLWGAAGAAGMLLFHGVVGLSVLPVAFGALALAWLLSWRWDWLPARGRVLAFAAALAAGTLLAAPYTIAISRGWAPGRSGLRHSYLALDPWMLWTIVTALAVALWFARRPLRRVFVERHGPGAVLAFYAAGMVAFSAVVSLPLLNHVKFVFQAFVALVAIGAVGFHDELAAWRRRFGPAAAALAFALVLCAPALLTVRGYLMDRSGRAAPELNPAAGEAALYAWMRQALPRDAVVVDHHFRALVMVEARRQLLLGDPSGPERAAYPLDQVLARRAVMADLYGRADSLERDVALLAGLHRPSYVLVRAADFAAPDSTPPPLDRRPDLLGRVYDRDGFVVYHVRDAAAPSAAAPGGTRP